MERIPFPNKLVNVWDIAKGLGDIALDFLIHPKEPMVSHGDHFTHPLDTPLASVIDWPHPKLAANEDGNRWDDVGNWHNPDGDAA